MRITRGLALLSLVVMHVAAIGVVVFILGAIGDPPNQPRRWPEYGVALLLGLLTYQLTRRLAPATRDRVWLSAGVVALLLLLKSLAGGGLSPLRGWRLMWPGTVPFQELGMNTIALLMLWNYGARFDQLEASDIVLLFRRRLVLITVLLILAPLAFELPVDQPPLLGRLIAYVVVFVVSALLASAGYTVAVDNNQPYGRRWLLNTVLPVVALMTLGLGTAALFSGGVRRVLGQIVGTVLNVAAVILGVVAGLIGAFLNWLVLLILPVRTPDAVTPTPVPTAVPDVNLPPSSSARDGIDWQAIINMLARGLTVILIFVLIIVVLRWIVRRKRKDRAAQIHEHRESLLSWGQVRDDLRAWIAGLFKPLRAINPLSRLRGNDAAIRIRRAYLRLLLLAHERQIERDPAQTPREYERRAVRVEPSERHTIADLTHAYEAARYGPAPPDDLADAAESAIGQIERRARGEGR